MLEFKFKLCAHDETSLWRFKSKYDVYSERKAKKFVLNYNKAGNVKMKLTLAFAA